MIAADGPEGLRLLEQHPEVRLVITDLVMPGMNGVEVVQTIRDQERQYTYLMVMTGVDDKEWLLKALAAGADDFTNKPILREELELRLQAANRLLRLEDQYKLVGGLAELAAVRAGEDSTQVQRLKHYCYELADDLRRHHPELGLTRFLVQDIANASVLHDIGLMNVPDSLLNKRGRLSEKEMALIQQHAREGGEILGKLHRETGSPYLLLAHEMASGHHERWDGSGYPGQIQGNAIPLPARILALADTYNALRSRRPYKDPMPREHSRAVIVEESGRHFDPMLVESFLRVEARMAAIHDQFRDLHETW
jgi:putative two-component system response regulator